MIIPLSGVTPDAIPNAIANGNATIPTMNPALTSFNKLSFVIVFSVVKNFGLSITDYSAPFSFISIGKRSSTFAASKANSAASVVIFPNFLKLIFSISSVG